MAVTPLLLNDVVPAALAPVIDNLTTLATDLRWTWNHAADSFWSLIDEELWDQTRNPFALLQNLSLDNVNTLSANATFREQLDQLINERRDYLTTPRWGQNCFPEADKRVIAYFSMEFGIGEALPLYAGGLGILSGDTLKTASDLGVPMIGIGLLYHEGYFRQMIGAQGEQQEIYAYNDSRNIPVQPLIAKNGGWLRINIDFPGRRIYFRVWQVQVGRVELFLLDSNDPVNAAHDQGITNRLYGGSQEQRFMQEIVLGIGGWRVIEALGIAVHVCHLNEGHAALCTIERARRYMQRKNLGFYDALWATRAANIFTTHTPVDAAFEIIPPALLQKYLADYAGELGISFNELAALGRVNANDSAEAFNMAYLAMRTCTGINAVSQLHAEVSRKLFRSLYPRWPEHEIPVIHITNGIHVPSWDSAWSDAIWTKTGGKERWRVTSDSLGDSIQQLSDSELWSFRGRQRKDLVHYVRHRMARQQAIRGASAQAIELAHATLDPNILTLGFARRFAEYKRPNLLLHDPNRLTGILLNAAQPVQIIVAGKAHPDDHVGKALLQRWIHYASRNEVRDHVVFLDDYDMALAQELVQGVDLWVNTPRRPWEACGTSGMKVLANGGLNLSSLDGWWAEAYCQDCGWALHHSGDADQATADVEEAMQLYRLLEEEIIPEFYKRDSAGIPTEWVHRMRHSMAALAPQFSSNRMLREYAEKLYLPAIKEFDARVDNDDQQARCLRLCAERLAKHWPHIHWGDLTVRNHSLEQQFSVPLYLGDIDPDRVRVELYAEPIDDGKHECLQMQREDTIPGAVHAYVYRCSAPLARPASDYTPRAVPGIELLHTPAEANQICWWEGNRTVLTADAAA